MRIDNVEIALQNDTEMSWLLESSGCQVRPHQCLTSIKIFKFKEEVNYLHDIFKNIYQHFLAAIDHLDYHPSKSDNRTWYKCDIPFNYSHYMDNDNDTLTKEQTEFVLDLLWELKRINLIAYHKAKRYKWADLLTWFLGWGVFSNSRNIKKLKKNIFILQQQNKIQTFQIRLLAKYLNLMMTHVNRHEQMLYELDNKLLIINKTLQDLLIAISYMKYETDLLDQMQNRLNHMYSSIHGLRFDTDSLYEFMRALASEQLNPMIIPPDILRNILQKVQDDIKTNARLKLPDDPVKNIWSYYGTTKLTPIVLENYLMLILTVPLIDTSLQMNLYKVHNLPTVHPVLQVQANYELEGKYFATLKHNMYVALPDEENVCLCIVTKGHLCLFNQALYPVEQVKWCVYALFIQDRVKIRKNCKISTRLQSVNMAYS